MASAGAASETLPIPADSTATAILRLVLGLVFFAHGAQKMLGWFGGYGFSGTMGFFTGAMHIPAPLAFLAIAAEFFAPTTNTTSVCGNSPFT